MRNPEEYASMGTDQERILARPGPHHIMKNSPDPKGHVPDANLPRYRHLRDISKHLEDAADMMGAEYSTLANDCYILASDFKALAQELRKDIE